MVQRQRYFEHQRVDGESRGVSASDCTLTLDRDLQLGSLSMQKAVDYANLSISKPVNWPPGRPVSARSLIASLALWLCIAPLTDAHARLSSSEAIAAAKRHLGAKRAKTPDARKLYSVLKVLAAERANAENARFADPKVRDALPVEDQQRRSPYLSHEEVRLYQKAKRFIEGRNTNSATKKRFADILRGKTGHAWERAVASLAVQGTLEEGRRKTIVVADHDLADLMGDSEDMSELDKVGPDTFRYDGRPGPAMVLRAMDPNTEVYLITGHPIADELLESWLRLAPAQMRNGMRDRIHRISVIDLLRDKYDDDKLAQENLVDEGASGGPDGTIEIHAARAMRHFRESPDLIAEALAGIKAEQLTGHEIEMSNFVTAPHTEAYLAALGFAADTPKHDVFQGYSAKGAKGLFRRAGQITMPGTADASNEQEFFEAATDHVVDYVIRRSRARAAVLKAAEDAGLNAQAIAQKLDAFVPARDNDGREIGLLSWHREVAGAGKELHGEDKANARKAELETLLRQAGGSQLDADRQRFLLSMLDHYIALLMPTAMLKLSMGFSSEGIGRFALDWAVRRAVHSLGNRPVGGEDREALKTLLREELTERLRSETGLDFLANAMLEAGDKRRETIEGFLAKVSGGMHGMFEQGLLLDLAPSGVSVAHPDGNVMAPIVNVQGFRRAATTAGTQETEVYSKAVLAEAGTMAELVALKHAQVAQQYVNEGVFGPHGVDYLRVLILSPGHSREYHKELAHFVDENGLVDLGQTPEGTYRSYTHELDLQREVMGNVNFVDFMAASDTNFRWTGSFNLTNVLMNATVASDGHYSPRTGLIGALTTVGGENYDFAWLSIAAQMEELTELLGYAARLSDITTPGRILKHLGEGTTDHKDGLLAESRAEPGEMRSGAVLGAVYADKLRLQIIAATPGERDDLEQAVQARLSEFLAREVNREIERIRSVADNFVGPAAPQAADPTAAAQ